MSLIKMDKFYEGYLTTMIQLAVIVTVGVVLYKFDHQIIGGILIAFFGFLLYCSFLNVQDVKRQRVFDASNAKIEQELLQLAEYNEFVQSDSFVGDDRLRQRELQKVEDRYYQLKNSIHFVAR